MNGLSRSLVRILVIATGEKELAPGEENIAAWVLVAGCLPVVLQMSISLLIIAGITHRSAFTEDVFFYSRLLVGGGILGLSLALAARRANRFVIRLCLIGAAILLIGPLLEVLTVMFGLPSTRQF